MNSKDTEKIVAIMKANCLHAYLATSDGDQPRVRSVSPIVEDSLAIWVATFSASRKVKQIRQNPKICLAFVEQPRGDKAATVIGQAEVIADVKEKKRVWKLATFDLSQHFPEGSESKEFCLCTSFNPNIPNFHGEFIKAKEKCRCGAEVFFTQPIFNPDRFLEILKELHRSNKNAKIIAGLSYLHTKKGPFH